MISSAVFLLFVSLVVYFYLKTKRKVDLSEVFPGPAAHPIFGNIFNFTFANSFEAMQKVLEAQKKYGEIFRLTLIRDYQFIVSDPKLYDKVLSSTTHYLRKNIMYDFLKPWLRQGLIISWPPYWNKHRKVITPAFHFKILEQFVEVFDRQCRIMIEKLNKCADGSVIDMLQYLNLMALDIITETAMGTQINAQTDTNSEYVNAVENITRLLSIRFSSIWRRFDFLYATFAYQEKRQQETNIEIMHKFSNEIIAKRREYLLNKRSNETNEIVAEDDDIGMAKKQVFLDILLQSTVDGRPLSNEEILEETDTFLFAGHDTTTASTCYVLYALSRNKHVQDKLLKEVVEVFGTDKNAPITYRQLKELKYMEMVIKETLRLYPAVPQIGRYLDKDIQLDDGRIIPADTNLTLNFYFTFRDPKYFKDPLVFDPERFSLENLATEKVNPFNFIPFSAGPRNCIGQKYAMLDMKTVVSKILLNFELIPIGDDPILTFEVVLRSLNGVQLGLRPRVYSNQLM